MCGFYRYERFLDHWKREVGAIEIYRKCISRPMGESPLRGSSFRCRINTRALSKSFSRPAAATHCTVLSGNTQFRAGKL